MLFRELDAEVYTFRPSTQAKAGRVLDQPCLHSELQAARVTYTAPPPPKDVIWLYGDTVVIQPPLFFDFWSKNKLQTPI